MPALIAILVVTLLSIADASATHLGPVIPGRERSEEVVFCLDNKSLDKMIEIDRAFIEEGNDDASFQAYYRNITPYYRENRCAFSLVRYTPKRILRRWTAKMLGPKGIERGQFVLIEVELLTTDHEYVTAFVITANVSAPTKGIVQS